jgi:hypothetical protein
MVQPTVPRQQRMQSAPQQKQSSSYYLLLIVKVLLVLIILLWLPKLVYGEPRHRHKRILLKLRAMRYDCQNEGDCSRLIPEESLNCVNECISPACYAQIFQSQPLEDGEVDIERAKAFDDCVQEELRVLRKQQRQTT